jgi:hypothetical protein
MSFGLGQSFGRLVKSRERVPPHEIITDKDGDYFTIVRSDGSTCTEIDTGTHIIGKNDQGYYLIDKRALTRGVFG